MNYDGKTDAEIRAMLEGIHTPELDAFRERVPRYLTSMLVMCVANSEVTTTMMGLKAPDPGVLLMEMLANVRRPDEVGFGDVIRAGILAAGDELDRRIPIPTTTKET